MTYKASSRRLRTVASLTTLAGLWGADAHAGGHKAQLVPVVPVYLQQAPTVQTYSAPSQVYSAPAQVYSAPTQVYSAPAQVYSAPAQVYSAPAQVYSAPTQVYSAPVQAYGAGGLTTIVGNAPVAGAKIKAVDREDIVSELRKEAKEGAEGTSKRERRKALRESARTKYAEAIGVEDSELSDADVQDLEIVVNSILDQSSSATNGSWTVQAAPTTVVAGASYAPALAAPLQPATMVQPVVPVQLLVPIQPKHHFFRK